jgi:hypothetical protein
VIADSTAATSSGSVSAAPDRVPSACPPRCMHAPPPHAGARRGAVRMVRTLDRADRRSDYELYRDEHELIREPLPRTAALNARDSFERASFRLCYATRDACALHAACMRLLRTQAKGGALRAYGGVVVRMTDVQITGCQAIGNANVSPPFRLCFATPPHPCDLHSYHQSRQDRSRTHSDPHVHTM